MKRLRLFGFGSQFAFYSFLFTAAIPCGTAVGCAVPDEGIATSGPATAPLDMPELDDPRRLLELAKPMVRGDTAAPITILAFTDFSCSHCKEFHEVVMPRLDLAYIDDGQVQLSIYEYPYPIGPHSFLAARSAQCAGDQGKYFEYSALLYGNQLAWVLKAGLPIDDFVDYAKTAQIEPVAFRQCVEGQKHAERVTATKRFGDALGVPGTPTIFVQAKGQMWTRVRDWSAAGIAAAIESVKKP
jgi:protein-disulfide isomerase